MKRPQATQMVSLAGSVAGLVIAAIAAVPAFATGVVNDGNYTIYVTSSGTPSTGTDPVAGTFTFADSSTFAGYPGAVVTSVGTISGGSLNGGTNPGSGFSSANTSNYIYSGSGSTITITFDHPTSDFGLLWGSIDSSNTLTFYNGATEISSYTGTQLVDYGLGAAYWGAPGSFVNWAADGLADDFTSVQLTDGGACCFEVDNFATNTPTTTSSVPEPATLSMMLGAAALAGLGAIRRRKRKAA
jgi:hypothetical protein